MTVAELISELAQFEPSATVAVRQHSEYTSEVSAYTLDLVEEGGYLSHPYPGRPRSKEPKLCVIIA